MKKGKESKNKTNKLEIKIDSENNTKINRKNNSNNNNRIVVSKTKNKQLTTESIFKIKTENNYSQLNYKNNISNPFKNSFRKSLENSNKKKSNNLSNSKIIKGNINLNSKETPKIFYNEKEYIKDTKNTNINNNDVKLNDKRNILLNQIKNINNQLKENKQKEGEIKINKRRSEYSQNTKNKITKKLENVNGKEDYSINSYINYKDKSINKNKSKKSQKKNIISVKRNTSFENNINKENGKTIKEENLDDLKNLKNGKSVIIIDNKKKEIVNKPINNIIKDELNEDEFPIIENNSNIEDKIKDNKSKIETETISNEKEENDSLTFNEDLKTNKETENIIKDETKISNEINNYDKEKETEKNFNGNEELKEQQIHIESKIKKNDFDILNNGSESINRITFNKKTDFGQIINNKNENEYDNNFQKINIQSQNEKKRKVNNNNKTNIKQTTMDNINSVNNILNNIQILINKSKNKIEKDLYEIEKKEKEKNMIYEVNNINNPKEEVKKPYIIFDKKNYHGSKFKSKKRRINELKYNQINITANDIVDNNDKNENIEKRKSSKLKNKNGIKKLNKKMDNNINKSYANNYINKLENENSSDNDNDDKNNKSTRRDLMEYVNKKKNKKLKYDDIDLNTLFSNSNKKSGGKEFIIKKINNLEKENGGCKDNSEENSIENFEEIIQEESENGKKVELKKIIIPRKMQTELFKEIINKDNNISYHNEEDQNKNEELININKDLINKITQLRKEVEFSKLEMKRKDEKLLKYVNKYDKIASENMINKFEIENLNEELINKNNEMDIKTRKIKELTDKNIGLEQEVNQLKDYYKNKDEYSEKDNKKYNISIKKQNQIKREIKKEKSEENINYEDLSFEELQNQRNELIKERKEITFLYDKLPIKLVDKEQIDEKDELEKKLNKINNQLMKIRLQLKNYNS